MMRGPKSTASAVKCLGILLLLVSVCTAGPVATFDFNDGSRLTAELLGFAGGDFSLRELEELRTRNVAESEIHAVDFGEIPIELGPARTILIPQGADPLPYFNWAIENRRFMILAATCRADVVRHGRRRVRELARHIEKQVETHSDASATNRDLRLAQVVVLSTLAERDSARRAFRKLQADYPEDEVIVKFERDVLLRVLILKEMRDRRGLRKKRSEPGIGEP